MVDGSTLGLIDGRLEGADEGDNDGYALGMRVVAYIGPFVAFSPPVSFPCLSSVLSSSSSICKYR